MLPLYCLPVDQIDVDIGVQMLNVFDSGLVHMLHIHAYSIVKLPLLEERLFTVGIDRCLIVYSVSTLALSVSRETPFIHSFTAQKVDPCCHAIILKFGYKILSLKTLKVTKPW